MGIARTRGVVLVGVEGVVVDVEVDLAEGVVTTTVVGLPDRGVNEAKDRVRAALANSGERWPAKRVTISLSPAWIPKLGAVTDLAVAVAMLGADGRLPNAQIDRTVVLGELGLDGVVKTVRGVLPAVMAARRAGFERVVVPAPNVDEACLVPGVEVIGVLSLSHARAVLAGEAAPVEPGGPVIGHPGIEAAGDAQTPELADVIGQPLARRALEVAAAGGHHLFLHGPPGVGKTMLAERLPPLMPALSLDAALEVTAVHSVAGTLDGHRPLVTAPPFEAPHHTATLVSLVGGGSGQPRPGSVSRAHRGVLFLDEAPEFARTVLDALREPLESGSVCITRSGFVARFPARFQLVLAANPCPCGVGDQRGVGCRCTPMQRRRYAHRISGPLLDRLDLVVQTQPVDRAAMLADGAVGESTAVVAERVQRSAARMAARLDGSPWATNATVPGAQLKGSGPLAVERAAVRWLREAAGRGTLSGRGIDKVLRVAWTLADLATVERPGVDQVAEAVVLRNDAFRAAA